MHFIIHFQKFTQMMTNQLSNHSAMHTLHDINFHNCKKYEFIHYSVNNRVLNIHEYEYRVFKDEFIRLPNFIVYLEIMNAS